MSLALCNPDAFYPFRSLVEGPLRDPADLPKIERFIRSIVLHDDMKMLAEPWPDMDQDHEWTPEEIAAGKRAVIVAIGPVIDEYKRHNLFEYQNLLQAVTRDDIDISNDLRQLAQDRAMTDRGPYFETHLEFIRVLLSTVAAGGSVVIENSFADDIINLTSQFPEGLLANLDREWTELVRCVGGGEIGLVVPPFLSILLTRCARRDAILNVLESMKNEFREPREKMWSLIHEFKGARTIAEANEIGKELQRAGELMSPAREWPSFCPVRTLWKVVISGISGAAVGGMAGNPLAGAAGAVFNQVAGVIANDVPEFRLIFGRGAFDLARRLNRDLRNIPRMPGLLGSILTRAENAALGLA
ncbi:MAG: hypothetical protein ACLQVL_13195 [Terriglobia bacterium]